MNVLAPETVSLVDPELYATGDPHPVWRWMRDHDPVRRHEAGEYPAFWSVTRYEDVRTVYQDAKVFSSAQGILLRPRSHGRDPGGGRTLALTDPPRHKALRSLVADWFTTRSVRALEDAMRGAVRQVVTRAAGLGTCDFVTDVAARLPLYVICRLMGVPDHEQEMLFALTSRAFGAGEPEVRSVAHQEIMAYFVELMYRRMDRPEDDLVSALVNGEVDGELLTEEDILLNCDNLLVGGTENVRLAVAGGMKTFLDRPDAWERLRADRGLMPTAVEEVLRWTSSATHIMRTVTEPVMLRDRPLEAGDRVVLWTPSANRDERHFADPDLFDIARRPNRHLALGAGTHFCLGAMMTRTEMRILFTELLDSVRSIEQTGPAVPLSSIVVNGLESLPVRITAK
ncbi:cytochrome P450 [Streptomyces sp. JS01]|uniref:Cytochrome P450 n=2 Tax=Streptomyces rubiginosohelvolus TaxID=67362 RepID=A0ABW6EVE9_9ACTN|nr:MULTISPECIES: cytochrome P450 [Streptomyces]KFK86865.1 cytochrome P450 [Streptomyces sp. JS01]MBK3529154.1 cytochrome P450 [Streptomyces sp. MBT72]MBK3535706.1 cytochrome P450 [Streptomyces sp. MBT67]MBK3543466.1 cytochrome P450 [Streptomyces sp. MBT60]MBK3548989.1 cytochrome P450 [Streptomyces sp. MBT61]